MNEKEHQKELKIAFNDNTLPIFLNALWALLTTSSLVFANEKLRLLDAITYLYGQSITYALMAFNSIIKDMQYFWKRHKRLCRCAFYSSSLFFIIGISLQIIIMILSSNHPPETKFGENLTMNPFKMGFGSAESFPGFETKEIIDNLLE